MKTATFYGVGVGPGDPSLLTLQAVQLIEQCPVIAYPQTAGEKTLALDIARQAVSLEGKCLLPLLLPMSRERTVLERSRDAAALQIIEQLRQGNDVAMLNLGDPSLYASFGYLLERVKAAGYPAAVAPGVTSFCASAALLQRSLTEPGLPLHIIPAGYGEEQLEALLDLPGSKVLMKSGRALPQMLQTLRRRGEKAGLVQNAGLPGERICSDLNGEDPEPGYFTTVLVSPGHRAKNGEETE